MLGLSDDDSDAEQHRGSGDYYELIWQVGIVMYYLIYWKLPFSSADDFIEFCNQTMEKENKNRPEIGLMSNSYSDDLMGKIRMCLEGLITPKAESRSHVKRTRPSIDKMWDLVKDMKVTKRVLQ